MGEFIDKVTNWLTQNKPSNELTSVANGKVKLNKYITAAQAYTIAKYNSAKTQTDLLKTFIETTSTLIETKMNDNKFCCMVEIDDDIRELTPLIIDYYKNALKFKVCYIDEDTKIDNPSIDKDEKLKSEISKNSAFLVLTWKDIKISDKDKLMDGKTTLKEALDISNAIRPYPYDKDKEAREAIERERDFELDAPKEE